MNKFNYCIIFKGNISAIGINQYKKANNNFRGVENCLKKLAYQGGYSITSIFPYGKYSWKS